MIQIISEGRCLVRAGKIIDEIKTAQSVDFLLALASTEISDLDNVSAAGADAPARRLTPKLDAEALLKGHTAMAEALPSSPAGVTSPVVLTRASLSTLDHTVQLVDCGSFFPPAVKFTSLGGRPAANFLQSDSLEPSLVDMLFGRGLTMGKEKKAKKSLTVLAECVPGGTTTALGLLKLLGVEADALLSSSIPGAKVTSKATLVEAALNNLAVRAKLSREQLRQRCREKPLLAIGHLGDPMQAFICGFVTGRLQEMAIAEAMEEEEEEEKEKKEEEEKKEEKKEKHDAEANNQQHSIVLAGGSQMLAVYALIKAIARAHPSQSKALLALIDKHLIVITTKWVAFDPFADTKKLAALIDAPYVAACPDFSTSRHPGIRAYEDGHVKEGVGAGAAMALASLLSKEPTNLVEIIDRFYEQMTTATLCATTSL